MEQLTEMHSNIRCKECMSGISGNLFKKLKYDLIIAPKSQFNTTKVGIT